MRLYSAADLHSNNHFLTIIDEQDKRILEKRLPNELSVTLKTLEPYRADISGIAVESTFNWYWLVDGLMEAGYHVMLVNPSKVRQYEGLKHTDDRHDAFWLAHQMRLGILPTGYIYPKEQRAVRDLLRERRRLVRQLYGAGVAIDVALTCPCPELGAEFPARKAEGLFGVHTRMQAERDGAACRVRLDSNRNQPVTAADENPADTDPRLGAKPELAAEQA